MNFRTCSALLGLIAACSTTQSAPNVSMDGIPRRANLQRASQLPWRDEGRCAVQEAAQPWRDLVHRCYPALDTRRMRFHDTEGVCPVASVGAATVPAMVAICLLSQPYIAVGAVVVIGTVVVAVAIQEELEAHARRRGAHPEETEGSLEVAEAERRARSSAREAMAAGKPKPGGQGGDWFPPGPKDPLAPAERRPECVPRRVPPKGGHPLHNRCADHVPFNAFRGANALVNGKAFDALQSTTRTLWEVKTDNFDAYTPDLRAIVIRKQVVELQRERELARACGFGFRVGVRDAGHKAALELAAPALEELIAVMDWC